MSAQLPVLNEAIEKRLAPNRPRAATPMERGLRAVDGLFDRAFGSRFNPLYRSGTIAVSLIAIVMVTGVYLLLFYDVAAPYASVARIEQDLWFGSVMRAAHRYASDATIVAIVIHMLRVFIQGKTWGPQKIAFITGILLTGIVLFAGFTGYVMVWDVFGRELAIGGAILLDQLPVFSDSLVSSFDDDSRVLSSFFFLNMFMHVALPLFLVFGMYLHTSRLARSVWFPEKRLLVATVVAFCVLSAVWPAPLEEAANAFSLPATYAADAFYGGWVPLAQAAPGISLLAFLLLGGATLLAPWWWRPTPPQREKVSKNDEASCEGCGQCTLDCPYEAITMVPRVGTEGSPTVARVNPDFCMSCGVCSASCTRMRIGPPERTGMEQQTEIGQLMATFSDDRKPVALITCASNPGGLEWLRGDALASEADVFPVSCSGNVHPFVVQRLLRSYTGVLSWSCPSRNCAFREGPTILRQRLLEEREPVVPGSIAAPRVRLIERSAAEVADVKASFEDFCLALEVESSSKAADAASATLRARRALRTGARAALRPVPALALSTVMLALIAGASGLRLPTGAPASELLLSWRVAGQYKEICRELTAAELASIPIHMQRGGQECRSEATDYLVWAAIDGDVVLERSVDARGARGDQPISVNARFPVTPGSHNVEVRFSPSKPKENPGAMVLEYAASTEFRQGERRVLLLDEGTKRLRLQPDL